MNPEGYSGLGEGMKLTEEQQSIIEHLDNMKIKAMAGTGKSTTLLQHAASYPKYKKLCIFFNKSMADDMSRRARSLRIPNLDVRTSHSLAFKEMRILNNYELGNFHSYDLLRIIPRMTYSQENLAICSFAIELYNSWCKSDKDHWKDISEQYFSNIKFVRMPLSQKKYIIELVSHIDTAIREKKLPLPHGTYLKWFQLEKRKLPYDIIYIDEAQDTSPVVEDIFNNQDHAIRIVVGDPNQSIYAWNGAINSLDRFDFPVKYLTQSFRFPSRIADLANEVLEWKTYLGGSYYDPSMKLKGWDKKDSRGNNLHAVLTRTNSQAIGKAIQDLIEDELYSTAYFEGGIDGYINTGIVTIYDLLFFKNNKKDKVRSEFLLTFKDFSEFYDFSEEHEERDFLRTIKLVQKYGNKLFQYIPILKRRCVKNKKNASIVYSTAHRSKGLEYSHVTILDDSFITKAEVQEETEQQYLPKERINDIDQDINLMYVAITRSQGGLKTKLAEKEVVRGR